MTGEEFIATVKSALSGYREGMDFIIDDRDIWIVSCDIFNNYARNGLFEAMKLDDPTVPNQFVTTFSGPDNKGIQLYNDKLRNLSYFNLPAIPINLPNRRGYRMVFPIRNMEDRFWIVDANEAVSAMSIVRGNSRTLAWPEGNRMYLSRAYTTDDAPRIVVMLVISGASSIDMEADLPMDPGLIQQARMDVINYFTTAGKPIDTTKDAK